MKNKELENRLPSSNHSGSSESMKNASQDSSDSTIEALRTRVFTAFKDYQQSKKSEDIEAALTANQELRAHIAQEKEKATTTPQEGAWVKRVTASNPASGKVTLL